MEAVANLLHQPAGGAAGGFELGPFAVHCFQKLPPFLIHKGDVREVHRNTAIAGVRGDGMPSPFQFVHPRAGASIILQRFKDRLAFYPFMVRHGAENGVQCPDAKSFVVGNRQTLGERLFGFQYNVAALLMDDAIVPMAVKSLDKFLSAQVARDFHELVRTSSRTKWRRISVGCCGRSK